MFTGSYFAKTYFSGSYFPPNGIISVPPVSGAFPYRIMMRVRRGR